MYLIIERDFDGELYAYFESTPQFKKIQSQRGGLRCISGKRLDDECSLHEMAKGAYMVIPVTAKNANIEKLLQPKKKAKKTNGRKKVKVSRS